MLFPSSVSECCLFLDQSFTYKLVDLESGFEGTGQEKTVRKKMSINLTDGGVSLN